MNSSESLLVAILATVARHTFPPADLVKILSPSVGRAKQVQAYNLCDGRTPQSAIGKKLKLDSGNFSRSIARWVEAGIVVRIGPEQYPLHVYPLFREDLKI